MMMMMMMVMVMLMMSTMTHDYQGIIQAVHFFQRDVADVISQLELHRLVMNDLAPDGTVYCAELFIPS